jgi:hypothetical protein
MVMAEAKCVSLLSLLEGRIHQSLRPIQPAKFADSKSRFRIS